MQKALLTSDQIRILMENGICGNFFSDLFKKSEKTEVKRMGKDININTEMSVELENNIRSFYEEISRNNN